ncbi:MULTISPECIES: NYN domain-containing protein [Cytobacillus]|uniref:NYN domain-containing protein n=1 Tax=Cytobacillus stercorigallinarum TaxID=2762240 RepID=A0ABR8QUL9_9BACI|nr:MULTISPECIES: NYN domain-containing protein [Cytobacillus]MBD7939230.1 NYN domain-containing protein [Cytobacillus stercorigallinarum]MCM3324334.1 NYN domain-containing protein [Cytobacillus kochii]MCM3346598.1 NYN domain-containing protein [Cytobacillus kochii]MDM5205521.1 NYN domain-containing protein [Cytobacillus kochii]
MNILLVDGYNIIGAWPELQLLKNKDLEAARDLLVEKMAEYQGYSGYRVIVVFDAHYVKGTERKFKNYNVEVIFTRTNETADERIEKLAIALNNIKTQIYVATSDFTEQRVIFAQGALRKSARELHNEMNHIEKQIDKKVKKSQENKPVSKIPLSDEIVEIFEKWRRER